MPWAASTLYLPDTPDARAVLLGDVRLAGHVYAVDLTTVDLPPQIGAGYSPRLLTVRSPVRARDLPLVGQGFDWKALDGALTPRLALARPALAGPASRIAPPDKPLRWMEALAAHACTPVVWYMAEALDGAPDAELAWVIDWRGPTRVDDEPLDRAPTVYTRRGHDNVRVTADGVTPHPREPLGAGLLHLGVRLDGPWFTPHRPEFDWEGVRLVR